MSSTALATVQALREAYRAQEDALEGLAPHQQIPETGFRGHVLLAGRGAGKSYAAMRWLNSRCLAEPGLRCRIIAPTFGDAVASCVEGPNGLLEASGGKASFHPSAPGGSVISYPNGSRVWVLGTPGPRDVDRLRALTNISIDVWEEAFANPWLSEAFKQAQLSRRRGDIRFVVTSTPRPHPLIKTWESDPAVTIVRAISSDNKHLDPEWLETLEKAYRGTRLYRQEVLGEVIEDVIGALWTQHDIDRSRGYDRDEVLSECQKIVIGVDPPSGPGTCGIVVVGKTSDGIIHVLDDYSVEDATPGQWASAVAQARNDYLGSLVVVETNQGGRMVTSALRNVDADMPITEVTAKVGKKERAQPIAILWEAEQQRGAFTGGSVEKLIDQCLSWVPGQFSPDRVDAMVWAASYLLDYAVGPPRVRKPTGRVPL